MQTVSNISAYPVSEIETVTLTHPFERSFSTPTFVLILKGSAMPDFGNKVIRHGQGDLIFLPKGRSVSFEASPETMLLIVGFESTFLEDQLRIDPLPLLSSALDAQTDYHALKRALLGLEGEFHTYYHYAPKYADSRLFHLGLLSSSYLVLKELTYILWNHWFRGGNEQHADRLRRIEAYIDLHYGENLSLTDLAQEFSLTPQYLSAFFSSQFGTNFKTYLNKKRLFYSLTDLRNPDIPINEIALSCGFMSPSSYRRNFLAMYGISPSAYRSKSLREETAAETALKTAHFAEEDRLTETDLLTNHISLDASGTSRIMPRSNRMINIGSVRHLLSEKYRICFLNFLKKMQFQYVRIEEILSNSFMPMLLPHYEYYFQNVDIVLNCFYENDVLPFIELTKTEALFEMENGYMEHYSIPRDDRFFRVLESFLKHVSRRWPLSWLNRWQFELWMLPRDTCESYAKAFAKAVRLIRRFIPEARIGGPGYDAASHNCLPSELFNAFRKEDIMPDFFSASVHYDLPPEGKGQRFSTDSHLAERICRELRASLSKASPDLPLYITEWYSVSADYIPITASLYQAAFIVRTALILRKYSDLSAYWLFSDTDLPPSALSGSSLSFGRGLFGPHFQPYASYYAFEFLTDLGKNLIFEGPFCSFTHFAKNHYQLLAFHYTHFRSLADPRIRSVLDFDRIYELFNDDEETSLSFDISGLTPGTYYLTTRILNRDHGSMLDTLIEEYAESNVDKLDFLYYTKETPVFTHFRRAVPCAPFERHTFLHSDGSLSLKVVLPPHAICLWDLRLQI